MFFGKTMVSFTCFIVLLLCSCTKPVKLKKPNEHSHKVYFNREDDLDIKICDESYIKTSQIHINSLKETTPLWHQQFSKRNATSRNIKTVRKRSDLFHESHLQAPLLFTPSKNIGFFTPVPTEASSHIPEITLAILAPNTSRHLFRLRLALIAVDYARRTNPIARELFTNKCKLIIKQADTDCDYTAAPINAYHFKKQKVHILFGPICEYSLAPVARYSRYWNLPVLTPGGMSGTFGRDKTKANPEFPLLTRIGATFDGAAKFVHTILKHFKWNNVVLLVDSDGGRNVTPRLCHLAMSDVVFILTQEAVHYKLYQFDEPEADRDYGQILKREVGLDHSIVILCASANSIREIMIKAVEMNFVNGEYVFLNVDLFTRHLKKSQDSIKTNDPARKGFESLMTITLRKPNNPEYKIFSDEVKRRAKEQYGDEMFGDEEVNSFVGAFHDAAILYALALNETLAEGMNSSDGSYITRKMWNRSFTGISGTVTIDENGDRNADYSLLDMNPETGMFEAIARYYGNKKRLEIIEGKKFFWPDGTDNTPPDVPICGFDNSGCPTTESFPLFGYAIAVLGLLLLCVGVATIFVFRHYRLETELAEINWRIQWEDIMFGAPEKRRFERNNDQLNYIKRVSIISFESGESADCRTNVSCNKQVFTKTGYYKTSYVAIKKIEKNVNITKPLLIEFKKMRDLQNDHIVRFIGVCIDQVNNCIVTEYCQKGSLQDVLENDQIKLDGMFKFSLMQDIVRGMAYLHNSDIKYHGNLKSSNCVVDSRFILKITDFGLGALRKKPNLHELESGVFYKSKLWTAPELLRNHSGTNVEDFQKGDVYSFAIIYQEIVYRNGVFWIENKKFNPYEIYNNVRNGSKPSYRPTLVGAEQFDEDSCSDELLSVVQKCWAEDPFERPDFHSILTLIKRINKDGNISGNLLENLLSRMEQYASNLEGLVEERTSDYLKQKKRAEDLLYMMLPVSVAEELMEGKTVEAVKFESVTIYFSDICGFPQLSAESSPMEVVDLLNDLYTTFDTVIETLDVYKVETIGDAYMVVSGLPEPNGNLHAREICRMAIQLLIAARSFKIRHRPKDQLNLRIGIHSGPVCAGIVGRKMPRYCLFGDTVNTASRMESNGEPLKIHVSPQTKEILDTFRTFHLKLRGPVYMKGKGEITTYWLLGESNIDYNNELTHKSDEH